jgi:Zn-finger nucleic acid-binding protein
MNCPKCPGTAMNTITLDVHDDAVPGPGDETDKLEIDRCARCGGVWFDSHEIDQFFRAKTKLEPPHLGPNEIQALDAMGGKCPRCAVEFTKANSPYNRHVTLDYCPQCAGNWVDGAELDAAGGGGIDFGERMKSLFGDLKP